MRESEHAKTGDPDCGSFEDQMQEEIRSREREQTQHGKSMVKASAALIIAKNVEYCCPEGAGYQSL